jgi:hypothetical protein
MEVDVVDALGRLAGEAGGVEVVDVGDRPVEDPKNTAIRSRLYATVMESTSRVDQANHRSDGVEKEDQSEWDRQALPHSMDSTQYLGRRFDLASTD